MSDDLKDSASTPWEPPFQGEIYDYARKLNLQSGYAKRGFFDVGHSHYLKAPLEAIRNPWVRFVQILKAVQTGGSLCLDITLPYWIEHAPGDTLWLLQDDDFAKRYAAERTMPLIQSVPEIQALLEGVPTYDKTKCAIKFRNMSLVIGGLNRGNVQSLSWKHVVIDEGWMRGNKGLIAEAKARTTAYPNNCKILLCGQGGVQGDDADKEWEQTSKSEWGWTCRSCGKWQPYEWATRRDDDSWAGMRWEEIKDAKGRWIMSRVMETVRMECRFCPNGHADNDAERRYLNSHSSYEITNPEAIAGCLGFHWPAMAAVDLPWAPMVRAYLLAKQANETFGHKVPIQLFYQKVLAKAWVDDHDQTVVVLTSEDYKPTEKPWEKRKYRFMTVDCQKDFLCFYVVIRDWSEDGESKQVWRGRVENWEQVAEAQKQFEVVDQSVFVDSGYEQTKVAAECVKHGHWVSLTPVMRRWACWVALKGSNTETWAHADKAGNKTYKIFSPGGYLDPNIGKKAGGMKCPLIQWSNLHCKDILKAYRDRQSARFTSLPETDDPTDHESYTAQMHSEVRRRVTDNLGRRVSRWLPIEGRHNHYWDCETMQVAAAATQDIIGAKEAEVVAAVEPVESEPLEAAATAE